MTFILTGDFTKTIADERGIRQRFAVSYNHRSGWEPANTPVVGVLLEQLEGVATVPHLPLPGIPEVIAPTLTGGDAAVISAIEAVADEVMEWHNLKWLTDDVDPQVVY
jgi:hypothetical protein